jgi:hypothetical protein
LQRIDGTGWQIRLNPVAVLNSSYSPPLLFCAGNSEKTARNSELIRCYLVGDTSGSPGFLPRTGHRPLFVSWKNSENSENSQDTLPMGRSARAQRSRSVQAVGTCCLVTHGRSYSSRDLLALEWRAQAATSMYPT